MERCKTCAHWDAVSPQEYGALRGAGICGAAPEIWTVTESKWEEDPVEEYLLLKAEHAGVLAMVADGSSYRAELVTMPDFGCVQHAPMVGGAGIEPATSTV